MFGEEHQDIPLIPLPMLSHQFLKKKKFKKKKKTTKRKKEKRKKKKKSFIIKGGGVEGEKQRGKRSRHVLKKIANLDKNALR